LPAAPVAALEISGLNAMQPLAARVAQGKLQDDALRLDLQEGGTVSIHPWPRHLPAAFGAQDLAATRTLHPAGPRDRIELRHLSAPQPWLVVLAGTSGGSPVVGSWKLERDGARWLLRAGSASRTLPAHEAARIRVQGTPWCVYLIDAQQANSGQTGVAVEGEARAALVALRTDRSTCRAAQQQSAR